MGVVFNLRWLALALLGLTAGFGGHYWWSLERGFDELRAAALTAAGQRGAQLADAKASEFDALIRSADTALRQFRDGYAAAGQPAAAAIAASALNAFPSGAIEFFAILDTRGDVAYATAASGSMSFGDRAYLRLHLDSTADQLRLDKPLLTRNGRDHWIFLLTRPVWKERRIAGVAVLAIPIDYLAHRLAQLELNPEDAINVLFDDDGTFLARNRDWLKVMDLREPPTRPFLGPRAPVTGVLRAIATVDRRPRLYAWQRLEGFPLVLTVGLDEAQLLAPVEALIGASRRNNALVTALIAALASLLGWLMHRSARQQERMQASEILLRSTLNATYDGIVVTDDEDRVLDANPQFFQFWDLPSDVFAAGDGRFDSVYPQLADPEDFKRRRLEQEGQDSKHWDTVKLRNGRILEAYKKIFDLRGRRVRLWCFRDITERKRIEAELQELAITDALTGLPNRRHFVARLQGEIDRVHRTSGYRAAFVLLDIDHFKRINDAHGHVAGDQVLRAFAAVLQNSLRKIDMAGRLGGEEFGIVLPEADAMAAQSYAQRVRLAVRETVFRADGREIPVTVSIGVAALAPDDANPDGVMVRADKALYRAKQAGRDRVEVAAAEPGPDPDGA